MTRLFNPLILGFHPDGRAPARRDHPADRDGGGSFTGRVTGMFASEGTVSFGTFDYRGSDVRPS